MAGLYKVPRAEINNDSLIIDGFDIVVYSENRYGNGVSIPLVSSPMNCLDLARLIMGCETLGSLELYPLQPSYADCRRWFNAVEIPRNSWAEFLRENCPTICEEFDLDNAVLSGYFDDESDNPLNQL